ncbi:MAG: hypothetical protein JO233_04965 [Candidatus Eremiobacteraeota bacterium]|nr:hypothetical protein [Candidatus Eremiobacteraeota bacterium]
MKKTLAFVTLALLGSVFAGCSAGGGAMIPATQQMQANSADVLGGGPIHSDVLGGGPMTAPHPGDVLGGGPMHKRLGTR